MTKPLFSDTFFGIPHHETDLTGQQATIAISCKSRTVLRDEQISTCSYLLMSACSYICSDTYMTLPYIKNNTRLRYLYKVLLRIIWQIRM